MFWIIQHNLFNEVGYADMISALVKHNYNYQVVKVVPFAHELQPDVDVIDDTSIVVMGSDSLVKVAEKKGWTPGAWTGPLFDHREWVAEWGDTMLNVDAHVQRFGDVHLLDARFIRPVDDFKIFSGGVVDPDSFASWQEKAVAYGDTLNADTMVVVAPLQTIYQEFRFFVVEGEIVTGSSYKFGDRVKGDPKIPLDVLKWTQDKVNWWGPEECYVIDVAATPDGFKIIEYNCINGSGFYACDVERIVISLAEHVERHYD